MQKLVNLIALLSGLVSLGVVGGGAYLFINKDTLIESARTKAIEEVTKTVTEALPGMVSGAMPKLPGATGGVVDAKPAIPGL
jgi:hypothetical protein